MPGKDHSRWIQNPDGSYSRRLADVEYADTADDVNVNATAGAAAAAEALGVDITLVVGTGKNGRVTKADVEAYADA